MAFVNCPPPPRYNIYFCGFIFCEVLNLLIVLFHFLLTHRFLHYRYFLYGFNVRFAKNAKIRVTNLILTMILIFFLFMLVLIPETQALSWQCLLSATRSWFSSWPQWSPGVAVLLTARRGAKDAWEKKSNVQHLPKNRWWWKSWKLLFKEKLILSRSDVTIFFFQPPATTGDGEAEAARRTSMQSVFLPWITSMIRFEKTLLVFCICT